GCSRKGPRPGRQQRSAYDRAGNRACRRLPLLRLSRTPAVAAGALPCYMKRKEPQRDMPPSPKILPEVVVTHVVTEADLASRVATVGTGGGPEGDRFPRVLGTARLIALMELAAARAMQPILGEEELSVGVGVRVEHNAPTPTGGTVRMSARYLGPEGKFHRFE